MIIINLANAIRLQKREKEATTILDKEDWSACDDTFQVSVAAVTGNVDRAIEFMKKIGKNGSPTAENYRAWPVFRSINTDERFVSTFEVIFNEPFIAPSAIDLSPESGTSLAQEEIRETPTTRH